ncbi:MAG: transglutaminase domain-containing protein [Planctomycetes bacterium]|nr:transglutaminase domain-containing protein [Planctomycetota bacterium]
MNVAGQVRPAVRWLSAVLQLVCAALALGNLPAAALPPGWLLAFTLPGAALGLLSRLRPSAWQRFAAATLMQTAACWLALEFVGPMTRPAALACTILPPLAFATVRQDEADRSLALFLSFCVLLIGVILDGIDHTMLGAFVLAACLTLRCAAHQQARQLGRLPERAPAPAARGSAIAATVLVAVYCLLATLAFDRALACLPSPAGGPAAPTPSSRPDQPRSAGLADDFVLGGGLLGGLGNEQLVRVRRPDGEAVPSDLYLRSGFFTVPDLDRWQIGPVRARALAGNGVFQRDPRPGAAVQQLDIERLPGAMNFVFAPPSTCRLGSLPGLLADHPREWLRQTPPAGTRYRVDYQRLSPPQLEPDAGPLDAALIRLPQGLDIHRLDALLARWSADGPAAQVLQAVADGLARHCRYDRAEPVGPFVHPLENFLFADGDRRGFCMHFASAAALMLRLRGIPCRIGVGLHGGGPDPDEPGARIYGSQHAHAWVEVPYGELGYLVFDPTPPGDRGRTPTFAAATDAGDVADAPEAAAGLPWRELFAWLGQGQVLAIVLVLALIVVMLPARTPRAAAAATPAPAARQARRLLARLLQQLARAGHVRRHRDTLEAFARELAQHGHLCPEIADAFAAYQDVRFGGSELDADRRERLRRGLLVAQRLTKQLAAQPPVPASGSQ